MNQISKLLSIALFFVVSFVHAQVLIKQIDTHEGGVTALCISNDASMLLSGGADGKTYLWNPKTYEKLKGALKHDGAVTAVAFNSNNTIYISGSADTKIRVFDIVQNIPVRILSEFTTPINALAINPINNFIAGAAKDNSIKIWDNSKSKASVFTMTGHQKEVTGLSFSPDGKVLCSSSLDNTIKFWNAATGALLSSTETGLKGVSCVSYSSDGKYLAAGGLNGTAQIYDPSSANKIIELTGYKSAIQCISFSADAQYIAAGGKDKKIFIWKRETGKIEKSFVAHENDITGAVFSNAGDIFISASMDGSIKIWDVKELKIGKQIFYKPEGTAILASSNKLLTDENSNGFLESGEKAYIEFDLANTGMAPAYNVAAIIALETPNSNIQFPKEFLIGNLDAAKKQAVKIPITLNQGIVAGSNTFTISIADAHGIKSEPFTLKFQIREGSTYGYIMITEQNYSSATGKAEIGLPITARIKIKNITKEDARNIKVNYLFPAHVFGVNKISELIPLMAAGEEKEIHVDFYADKEFALPEIKIGVDIQGVAFSNAKDITLHVKINEGLSNVPQENLTASSASRPVIAMVQPKATRNEKIVWVEKEITLKGEVSSQHPINEFFINGVEVPLTHQGFIHTIKLAYRDNPILIKAIDSKGNVSEHTFVVERQVKIANVNDTLKRQGKDYALVIVTDDYENYNKLTNPINDGQTIAKELRDSYGFTTEILLNPLASDIYTALRNYSKKVYNDDDQLLIFIAGHGEFDDVFKEGYIVTKDSKKNDEGKQSFISHSNLRTIINNIPCRHILLTMDVCFGGTFDQFVASSRGEDLYYDIGRDQFIKKKMQYTTRKYLTSGGKEYVPDGRPGEHSPFARKYLDALRSYGGQDGILTYNELYTVVEKAIPGPKAGEFGSNQPGSDFLFYL